MVIFQHRAWRLVTTYEKLVGTWPYQSRLKNYILRFCLLFCIVSAFATLWIRMVEEFGVNTLIVAENSVALILMIINLMRLMMPAICEKQRRKVYERVVKHFNAINDKDEIIVLQKHSNEGLRLCYIYTGVLAIGFAMYYILPNVEMFYNYLIGKSELEKRLPMHINYVFLDEKQHFYYILIHMFVYYCACVINHFAFDLSFIIQVYHICALYEIVRMRLNKASNILSKIKSEKSAVSIEEANNILTSAIDMHNEVLHLTKLVEKAYNVSWFIILILNSIVIGLNLSANSIVLNNPFGFLRYTTALTTFLVNLYVIFSQGQRVINSSSSIFEACYNCTWYNARKHSRTLLSMMMSRSLKPCKLTGGNGIFILSMKTYAEMLKLGFSIFTVFNSAHQ